MSGLRRLGVGLVGLLALVGCGLPPAPVGYHDVCDYVRDAVKRGLMPYNDAVYLYPECSPIPRPNDD